jgi:hypothetical protein
VTGSITGSLLGTASFAATASFALNAGSGGGNITIADEGTTQGTASYFNFTGAGVTATVNSNTASINISSTGLVASNYVVRGTKQGGAQTIPNGVDTVITFSDDFDPNNWLSSNKIQPTIAGYYIVNAQVWWDAGSVTDNQTNIQLKKNGTTQVAINQTQILTGVGYAQQIDSIIYFNGSTDYIEVTAFTGNPTSQNTNSAGTGTWVEASLIVGGGEGGGTPEGADTTVQFNDNGAFSGSGNFTFNKTSNILQLTGSMNATSFTGSLQGTASFATSASRAISSSFATTASFATTSSFALNSGTPRFLNFSILAASAGWSAGTTYYFGATTSAVDTTANRNRGVFNKAGTVKSITIVFRATNFPASANNPISFRTATGNGTLSTVASNTFNMNGQQIIVFSWTGLNISVAANDTYDFAMTPQTAFTNALLTGNIELQLT